MTHIPFVDLQAQYATIRNEISEAIQGVLDSAHFINGPQGKAFEQAFAAFCQASHAVGCGNGTDALYLALRALGIGPGDEIITTPNTFIATAEAVSLAGATPVFIDVDEMGLMNTELLEAACTERTRAVVPVHLRGEPAEMDAISEIAKARGLRVIEDAAQAHGAQYRNRVVGGLGDIAAFSFYPGKNLGAFGDAGAVTTNDEAVATKVRMLRDHGRTEKYIHEIEGVNSRLDELQAAVLTVKLRHLARWNDARRRAAVWYTERLRDLPNLVVPVARDHVVPVYHLFAVRTDRRDELMTHLKARGIACGVHYPVPLHLQPAYRHLGYRKGSFPHAERMARTSLSLPIYPEITEEAVDRVASVISDFIRRVKQ